MSDGDISKVINYELLFDADLIFIDDSDNQLARSNTIKMVSKYLNKNSIVLVHDYETTAYVNASNQIKCRFNFNALYPNTGLMSNSVNLNKSILQKINFFIWLMKNERYNESKDYWKKLFLKYEKFIFSIVC